MKLRSCLLLFLCLGISTLWAQKATLSGTVSDGDNGEVLIGATISANGIGTLTDIDRRYTLDLPV